MELSGKTALVTGGGSGIGLGIALALAGEGCRVAIAGRGAQRLRQATAEFPDPASVWTRPCDVADRADAQSLIAWVQEEVGPLEILVNSAGLNVPKRRFAELDPADWDKVMAINVTGAFNCIHATLPAMRERGRGLIVNISSVAGKRALRLAGAAYCASKFAMSALGTEIGLEERAHGIHVTNIYPGEVNTPILDQRPTPVPPEKKREMLQPEDLGALVVALARLPSRVLVPELVVTPLYQEYA